MRLSTPESVAPRAYRLARRRFTLAVAALALVLTTVGGARAAVEPWPELVQAFGEDVKKIAPTFEALYGDELLRVEKTEPTIDDMTLSRRLLTMAERSTGKPALLGLAAQYAYTLGMRDARSYETAEAAMALLTQHAPEESKPLWENRLLALKIKRLDLVEGDERAALAGELLTQLDTLAQGQADAGNWKGAAQTWADAAQVATDAGHADAAALKKKSADAEARLKAIADAQEKARLEAEMAAKMKAQREAQEAAEAHRATLNRLIVQRDDPRGAWELAKQAGDDAELIARLELAAQPIEELAPDDARTLGTWYLDLAAGADGGSRTRMMIRAWRLFDRYLEQTAVRDAAYQQTRFTLDALTQDLRDAGVDSNQLVRLDRPRRVGLPTFSNDLGMRFVRVAPGEFTMGSPEDEPGRRSVESAHTVDITKPYWIGVIEVTQAQWKKLMGTNPSKFVGDDLPVDSVSWRQAMDFCKALSERDGRTYRLPTEAQWERACRAGTAGRFADNSVYPDAVAWYDQNADGQTRPVAARAPNAWGIFDMHGNVAEWCLDYAAVYETERTVDPQGPATGDGRIVRGGSYQSEPEAIRSAARHKAEEDRREPTIGFRVVMLDEPDANEIIDPGDMPTAPEPAPDKPTPGADPKPEGDKKPPTFFGIPTDKK